MAAVWTSNHKRHTNAAWLLSEVGMDIKEVSERLGHEDITTTYNLYSHVIPSTKRKSVDIIEAHLNGKASQK
ncbi:MAG: tyrosine-type recombinase/integrase [Dethiobacter sp.]|nr:tyrosine-type recombinase/integrase [Dethiobacter sp.]